MRLDRFILSCIKLLVDLSLKYTLRHLFCSLIFSSSNFSNLSNHGNLLLILTYVPLAGLSGVISVTELNSLTRKKVWSLSWSCANYSNEMAQWILKDTMKITASHTV